MTEPNLENTLPLVPADIDPLASPPELEDLLLIISETIAHRVELARQQGFHYGRLTPGYQKEFNLLVERCKQNSVEAAKQAVGTSGLCAFLAGFDVCLAIESTLGGFFERWRARSAHSKMAADRRKQKEKAVRKAVRGILAELPPEEWPHTVSDFFDAMRRGGLPILPLTVGRMVRGKKKDFLQSVTVGGDWSIKRTDKTSVEKTIQSFLSEWKKNPLHD